MNTNSIYFYHRCTSIYTVHFYNILVLSMAMYTYLFGRFLISASQAMEKLSKLFPTLSCASNKNKSSCPKGT